MGRGAPAARRDDVHQRQSQDVAVEAHGLAQLPGGAGGVVHAMQAQRGEVVAVMIGSMDVGLQKARTQPRRQFASRRVAAGSSPSASARPWWSPRMRRWVLSAAESRRGWRARRKAGLVARVFDDQRGLDDAPCRARQAGVGRQAGPGGQPAFRRAEAGETDRAVVRRIGSLPHSEPGWRSDGSRLRSRQRRSASLRQTTITGVCAAWRRSSGEGSVCS